MKRRVLAGFVLFGLAVGSAGSARATFPGRPGLLAYEPLVGYGAYTVRPDGTDESRILSGATGVQWSPDGQRLVYVEGRSVWLAGADGRHVRRVVTAARAGFDSVGNPNWSPDGRTIVFDATRLGDDQADGVARLPVTRVLAAAIHGAAPRNLHSGLDPTWSPSGASIAYVTDNRDGRGHRVAQMRPDGTASRILVRDPRYKWALEFSPDGRRLVWMQEDGMHVLSVGTGRVTTIPNGEKWRTKDVTWHPRGHRLAYLRQTVVPAGHRTPPDEMWTVRPDGGDRRLLLRLPFDWDEGRWATHLAWQPLPAGR